MLLFNLISLVFLISGHKCDLSINASSNYSDTCDYSELQYPCGDICVSYFYGKCTCGDEVMGGWGDGWIPGRKIYGILSPKYC